MRSQGRFVLSAAAFVLAASGVAAQVTPPRNGDEFQVNGYTTGFQGVPAVAMDGSGHYVVVWDGVGEGDDTGIFGRRYRSSGEPLGPQFRVNSLTANEQYYPAVGADNAGNFVVVWHGNLGDGNGYGVLARRFRPDGTPFGPEFQVNSYTPGHQLYPDVAVAADGSFVVAWDSADQDGDLSGIFARRYDSAGLPLGVPFAVNTHFTGSQYEPAVRVGSGGAFVVAWFGVGADDDVGIFARRFDAVGPQGDEFRVNEVDADDQVYPSLAMGTNNEFVVAWTSYDPVSDADIFVRRFDASGTPVAGQTRVNTHTPDSQATSSVALDAADNFLVTWTSTSGLDPSALGVIGRHFDANGDPTGGEFLVNTYTTGLQDFSQVAARGPGDFVVVWEGEGAPDTNGFGVFGQRYGDLFFSDKVDSGELIFWSSAQTDFGDLSAHTSAALASSAFGLRAVVDDTAGLFVQDDTPNDENRYRARFYLDPNGFDPGESAGQRRNRVFIAFAAPSTRVVTIVMRRLLNVYSLAGRVRQDNNTRINTPFTTISDAPHYVEFDWQRSTGPDTNDGTFQMWIDGVSVGTLTGMDNSLGVDFVRFGTLTNKSAANGTVHLDEFVSRRANPIGPVN